MVISTLVAFSISSFASISSNTQFVAGNVTLSSVLRVASTRGMILVSSTELCSTWQLMEEHNREDTLLTQLRAHTGLC